MGVLDEAGLIDEEGGTLWHATHDEVFFGEELVVGDAVGFGSLVVVVGEELKGDAFFFGPSGVGEGVVAGDAEDLAVEVGVGSESGGDFAEFFGALPGEGHGDEEEEDVLLAGLFGEFDNFGTAFAEGDEGKIRGLIANFDAHIEGSIGRVLRMQTGILSFVGIWVVGHIAREKVRV